MNKKLKMQIQAAFDTQSPVRKREFLQRINFPKIKYSGFILSQIGYIRKRVWLTSIVLVMGALLSLKFAQVDDIFGLLWIISSVMPFIVLVAVMEISRSTSYHMTELEMSCKYSLSDIVLVRLGILGGLNTVVLVTLLLLMNGRTDYSFWRLGIYMLVPFMFTCTLSLFVLNYVKTRDTSYICGGISCFVSMLNSVLMYSNQAVFTIQYFHLWDMVFFALLVLMILQVVKLIKKTEELQWSLQ